MPFTVTILGSSSALPTSTRFPSAHVLNAHERLFLIDCGEGTQVQLRRFKQKLSRVDSIFISHVHGDHTLGIFGLISTLNLLGRKNELNIYAHAAFEPVLKFNLNFFANEISFPINFNILKTRERGVIFTDSKIEVEAFPLKHRIPSTGFIFREQPKELNIKKELIEKYTISFKDIVLIKKGADLTLPSGEVIPNSNLTAEAAKPVSYAYCSDTMYSESVAESVKNIDVLYHEATFAHSLAQLAKATGHSTALQAAKIAAKAGVGKLIIGHFSSRYKHPEVLLNEARTIFPETYLAEDGLTISIRK